MNRGVRPVPGFVRFDFRTGGQTLAASLVAIALACRLAWGHSMPPVRTVVIQVEGCEVALLVGYRAGNGEAEQTLLARATSQPKSRGLTALRDALAQRALGPLTLSVDGVPLVPTSVQAKVGLEADGARAMVAVLVTYSLPPGAALSLTTTDPRSTRISWTDRDSGRVEISDAPAQGHWFAGVASMLLNLRPSSGGSVCGAHH